MLIIVCGSPKGGVCGQMGHLMSYAEHPTNKWKGKSSARVHSPNRAFIGRARVAQSSVHFLLSCSFPALEYFPWSVRMGGNGM